MTTDALLSWDGKENLTSKTYLGALSVGLQGGLAFSSSQAAVSACLELLGSRYNTISVILPINIPYDALMGVIRANARPIILDLDVRDAQMATKQLQEALETFPESVVYLNRPGGQPVRKELLEAVQDVITICDTRMLPMESEFYYNFNIYDISVIVGDGAILFHKDEGRLKELQQIRFDSRTELPETMAALMCSRYNKMLEYPNCDNYHKLIVPNADPIESMSASIPSPTFLGRVPDADKVITAFNKQEIPIARGCIPVYKWPVAKKRWQQEPNYPVAEKLYNELVLLPNHREVNITRILEALHAV